MTKYPRNTKFKFKKAKTTNGIKLCVVNIYKPCFCYNCRTKYN